MSFLIITREKKRETNLGDAEIGENEAPGAGSSPDEEHLDSEASRARLLVNQVGGSVTDGKVPEPVGGDGEGHGSGTDVERVDFTSDDPSDGTPRGGEEGDVDANESDQNLLSGRIRGRDHNTNDGDQELANGHADGTDQERPPTAELLDIPHARDSREDVDDVDSDGNQKRVGNTRVLEKRGPVVDDKVDPGELLPGLEGDTREGTKKNFVGGAEAVEVRRLAQLLLVLVGDSDLVELGLDLGMVGRKGDETGESTGGISVALLLDEPSGRLGEEDHTDSENETPDKLESDGKLPRSRSWLVLGGIVDNGGKEKADGDCPLVTSDEGATVLSA